MFLKSILPGEIEVAAPDGRAAAKATTHYRPDVDGLRAIAVVPVVLFHAGFSFISGGFVGVDVFFVISGFLITGILSREIVERRFSILEFYRRRARRIFPALTVVTFTTLVAGYFLLSPKEYVNVAKSAASLTIFSSNFYFWRSVSYFQSTADIRPLLHTWSLAVEEQYYLFFPLLLWLLNIRRRGIAATLWLIVFASLACAAVLVAWKPNAAFYLLPSRAWELMMGGLLAIGRLPRLDRKAATAASATGLALIAVPMLSYTSATPFPGFAAAPPVIGTAFLIWAGGEGAVGRFLSQRWIVAVGQASYSIYLWHVPVLAFAGYLVADSLSTPVALALCAVSLVLGFGSLHVVERPFRAGGSHRNRMAAIAALGMVAAGVVSLSIIALRGMPGRLDPATARIVAVADDEQRHHSECMTLGARVVPPANACRLGAPGVKPTVLLWGDSHAMVTATALERAARRERGAFLFAADADCPSGIGFTVEGKDADYSYCERYNAEMLRVALHSPTIQTVVFSSRWTNWRIGEPPNPADFPAPPPLLKDRYGTASSESANRDKWERGFTALVDRLLGAGKRVVIVGPLPEPSFNVPHRLFVQRFGVAAPVESLSVARDYQQRHRTILAFFSRLRGRKGLSFIWPEAALCSRDQCPIVERGEPIFFDHDHLSVFGARKTSALYDEIFGQ